jgi:hypothetical protein
MAGKSDNPAQVMPRAIAGTLIGATLLSVLAQVRESAYFNAAMYIAFFFFNILKLSFVSQLIP